MKKITTEKPHSVFSMEADRDYILARLINFSGAAFAPRAGYYSQQTLEKYLKAFLVQEAKAYPLTHDLLQLADECSKVDSEFKDKEFLDKLSIFNEFIDLGRYGGEASKDPRAVKNHDFETAGVIFWAESNILILDELVHKIRGKLNFNNIGFYDNLQAILKEDNSNFFVGTWKLPIKLKDVLTVQNKYFVSQNL